MIQFINLCNCVGSYTTTTIRRCVGWHNTTKPPELDKHCRCRYVALIHAQPSNHQSHKRVLATSHNNNSTELEHRLWQYLFFSYILVFDSLSCGKQTSCAIHKKKSRDEWIFFLNWFLCIENSIASIISRPKFVLNFKIKLRVYKKKEKIVNSQKVKKKTFLKFLWRQNKLHKFEKKRSWIRSDLNHRLANISGEKN